MTIMPVGHRQPQGYVRRGMQVTYFHRRRKSRIRPWIRRAWGLRSAWWRPCCRRRLFRNWDNMRWLIAGSRIGKYPQGATESPRKCFHYHFGVVNFLGHFIVPMWWRIAQYVSDCSVIKWLVIDLLIDWVIMLFDWVIECRRCYSQSPLVRVWEAFDLSISFCTFDIWIQRVRPFHIRDPCSRFPAAPDYQMGIHRRSRQKFANRAMRYTDTEHLI